MTLISPNWCRSQHFLGPNTSSGAECGVKSIPALNYSNLKYKLVWVFFVLPSTFDNYLCKCQMSEEAVTILEESLK